MTAKNRGSGPIDRSHILLLPMLYWVGAAGRAHICFTKLRCNWSGPDGAGGVELVWKLAFELKAAEAAGMSTVGRALDWQKSFDNVGLKADEEIRRRHGLEAK